MTAAPSPTVVDERANAAWATASPAVSVLVSTYQRAGFLDGLLDAIERLEAPARGFEVIVVDNGSADGTWTALAAHADTASAPFLALRIDTNDGPAPARNAAAARARGAVLAVTDDDCLPTPRWLVEVVAPFADPEIHLVQGRVAPEPSGAAAMQPWDHTKVIAAPTPFFETCNVAYRAAAFTAAGGFDEGDDLLRPPSGHAFGEDACLAAAILSQGGRWTFADAALVHHRCIPSTYRQWLRARSLVVGFPGLARRCPMVADWLRLGVFLDADSAAFTAAAASGVAAVATGRPVLASGALPWLVRRWRRAAPGSTLPQRLGLVARLGLGDAVTTARLVQGSVRHRRLVL